MSDHDLDLAKRFLEALAAAAATGDRDGVLPLLAPDVEWLTPQLALHGIGEVRERLDSLSPGEHLEIDFDEPELTDLGSGRILTDVRETYRMKETGDFAYARERRIELTIREGMITRYEMRFAGS
jgi:ketosteroid isomerase-like protein